MASPWLPDGARYEQQRPITLAVREAASKQFCCSPHFRGGKIHLHSRGLTLLARGSIGSSKNEWGNGAVPHRPSVQYVVVVVVVVVTILVYYTTRFWNPHTIDRGNGKSRAQMPMATVASKNERGGVYVVVLLGGARGCVCATCPYNTGFSSCSFDIQRTRLSCE